MAFANIITRALPFAIFNKKKLPKFIEFIQKAFPPIILTILVFYTLSDIDFFKKPYGLNEVIAIIVTIILHLKFNNYLLSIVLSTAIYMLLINLV
jgi:branched-subunit amino acid transport protein AzlD